MKIAVAGGTGTVGRYVVSVARSGGAEIVSLSRKDGIDLVTGRGLRAALDGVDTVIDVAGVETLSEKAAVEFFRATTTNLLDAERAAGIHHHIALSIVGVDRVAAGYYAGKLAQERLVERGPIPWTILRATQFHEFAAQILARGAFGPLAVVPTMTTQPIAAREVAEVLVAIAHGEPQRHAPDLGGPQVEQLRGLVRAYARATHARRWIVGVALPGKFGGAMRDGTLIPAQDAQHGKQTFTDWLQSADFAATARA
jgi:uncharacterized protein YbjT (DUF2867 family)